MKDSGIEWIGEIPQHWKLERLKFHAVLNPLVDTSDFENEDEVSFVPMENLKSGYHGTSIVSYSKVRKGYTQFNAGDILIAKVTPCFENGNIAIASDLIRDTGFGSTEINVIRCGDISTKFLFYYMQNPKFIERGVSDMFGVAGLKRLVPEYIVSSFYPLPPDAEQQAIADYLDRKCGRIDAMISAKEKTNALLMELRQSTIYEAITKGLDPGIPMKDSGVEWIGKIPDDKAWTTVRLKHIVFMKSGENITAHLIDKEGDYPVYGGNGLRGYNSSYTHDGDYILIGRQGALCGNVHLVQGRFWASEHAIVVTVLNNNNITWLSYLFQSMNLNQYSESAAQPGISVEKVGNLYIPCPNTNIQQQIADYLDHKCAEIDSVIAANITTIDKLKEYRQSIIYEAVTGKTEVA